MKFYKNTLLRKNVVISLNLKKAFIFRTNTDKWGCSLGPNVFYRSK